MENRERSREKTFRLACKTLFLTYPKCDIPAIEAKDQIKRVLDKYNVNYIVVAIEHHKDGDKHIHSVVQFEKKCNIKKCDYLDITKDGIKYHGKYESCKSVKDAIIYCKKEGEFIEEGEALEMTQSAIQLRAQKNKLIIDKPLDELIDEGIVAIQQTKQLLEAKNIYTMLKDKVPEFIPRICLWIYGKSGIGKSYWCRSNFQDRAFPKVQNKWWDGYKPDQKIVLLEDFDLQGACLGHYLKIWSDDYRFNAEIKGSTITPAYEVLCVTSQYLPKDIWAQGSNQDKWDQELIDAIDRRFIKCTIIDGNLTLMSTMEKFNWMEALKEKRNKFKQSEDIRLNEDEKRKKELDDLFK